MMKEGWLEDVDDVKGLDQVAKALVDNFRDANGKAKVVPVATDGSYFGYRTDMITTPVKSIKDLLDPGMKGKIGLLDPSMYSFTPYIAMALELGGSEKNLEPAWDFMKQLAASGNVAQVLKSDVDTINALTTGAVALSYTGIGNWGKIDQAAPIKLCNRVDGSKGLKAFLFTLGWVILKGSRVEAAKEFAIRADHDEAYAAATTASPANVSAKPSPELAKFVLTSQEDIKNYAYFPDFDYISQKIGDWSKRFETEIQPLLRKG
jgi:putative spermidine/putrescine transport system substrate-binding protein